MGAEAELCKTFADCILHKLILPNNLHSKYSVSTCTHLTHSMHNIDPSLQAKTISHYNIIMSV